MLVALYEFKIKENMKVQFEENWALFTDAIYRVRGSKGSRLHTTKTKDTYLSDGDYPYTEEELISLEKMREALADSKVLHLMDVLDDRLKD